MVSQVQACLVFVVLMSGCVQPDRARPVRRDHDIVQEFEDLVERHEFYEAYRVVDIVLRELATVPEGVAGFEYDRLVGMTAGVGQDQWVRILEDPEIQIGHKHRLVADIHETAVK